MWRYVNLRKFIKTSRSKWSGTEKRNSGADHVGDLGVLGVDLAGALGDLAAGYVDAHGRADLGSGQAGKLSDLVGGELALGASDKLGDHVLAGLNRRISLAGLGAGLLVAGIQLDEGILSELNQLGGDGVDGGDGGVELTVSHGIFLSCAVRI